LGVDHRRTALIVGAGIGGLAAGIALGRAGWDIRIFERAPTPRDIGFALGLAPNAMAALRGPGVADAVRSLGITPTAGEMHEVASRRAELALRIALGAAPMRILSATLGQGALMVGSGLAAGGVLSIWAARALGGFVPATGRVDALSAGIAATVLVAVGAAAVLPAARRASSTDPLIALRNE